MRELTQELGRRLRARRLDAGLTQKELAERARLHYTYVGQVERGERDLSLSSLVALADGLGRDPGELVEGLRLRGEA